MKSELYVLTRRTRRNTVLIVDDQPDFRGMLSTAFSRAGYTVEEAANGLAALARIEDRRFDLIVTDIIMPDADGYELIQRLRTMPDRPPVIALSGGSSRLRMELPAIARLLGADSAFSKPVELSQLLDEAERLIGRDRDHGGAP